MHKQNVLFLKNLFKRIQNQPSTSQSQNFLPGWHCHNVPKALVGRWRHGDVIIEIKLKRNVWWVFIFIIYMFWSNKFWIAAHSILWLIIYESSAISHSAKGTIEQNSLLVEDIFKAQKNRNYIIKHYEFVEISIIKHFFGAMPLGHNCFIFELSTHKMFHNKAL